MRIEPIALRHAAGFHACLDAVARESLSLGQSVAPPLERVETFVRENIEHGHAQFVAVHGDEVLGWCDAIPLWADGLRHRAQLGLGVRKPWRRQGIGEALVQRVIERARATGLRRIDLEARADNAGAIRLYERLGFVIEGRRAQGLCHRGVYFETVEMGLLL